MVTAFEHEGRGHHRRRCKCAYHRRVADDGGGCTAISLAIRLTA
jgi:hypothetical protein